MSTATRSPIRMRTAEVRFLLDDIDTAGAATVFETRIPVGSIVPPPHSHDGFEETVYGLEGIFTFMVDGVPREIGPGEAAFIARGQVHSFDNTGGVDGAFLSVATPGVFRPAYFQEMAEVLATSPEGPPDVGAIFEVMTRHGLTPALPGPPAHSIG